MRTLGFSLIFGLFFCTALLGQVKIGDNPQTIDPGSVLELESTDRAFVITRVTTAQMEAIVPLNGAMVYNTDIQCVHYFNGTEWVNLCADTNINVTTEAIVNTQPTIVLTQTVDGNNIEVAPNSIRTEQIVDGGVNGVDIQDNSIGPNKLADNAVGQQQMAENAVGPFALDRDNVPLSFFINDVPFLVAGDIPVDGDTDSSNELLTNVVLQGTNLVLSEGTNQRTVSLASLNNSGSDNQTLTLNNNVLGITNGNTVNLSAYFQQLSINNNQLSLTNGGSVPLPVANGAETVIDPVLSTITVTGTGTQANPYVLTGGGAGPQNLQGVLTVGNDAGGNAILNLQVSTDPASAATRGYVDANLGGAQNLAGVLGVGNSAANLQINNLQDPTLIQDAATKGYVDNAIINAAPDGSETIIDAIASTIGVSGSGTLPDPYVLLGGGNSNLAQVLAQGNNAGALQIENLLDPNDNQDAATKKYVDDNITAAGGGVPTDELNFTFEINGGNLEITDNGGTLGVPLSGIDTNTTNTSLTQDGTSLILTDSDANTVFIPLAQIDTDDQTAAQVPYDNTVTSLLTATTAQGAIDEIAAAGGVDTNTTNTSLTQDGTSLILTDSDASTVFIPLAQIDTDDQTAAQVPYDNTVTSLLTATTAQGAIDEIAAAGGVDTNTTNTSLTQDGTSLILTDSDANTVFIPLAQIDTDDQTAAQVPYDNTVTSLLTATTAQGAIDEIAAAGGVDTNTTNTSLTQDGTSLILTDSDASTVFIPLAQIDTDDQTAAQVPYDNTVTSLLTATTAQGAIDEIAAAGGVDTNTTNTSLTQDGTSLILTDSDANTVFIPLAQIDTDDQTAAQVPYDNTVTSLLTATTAQGAIDEIAAAGGVDTNTTNTSLTQDGTSLILTDSDANTVFIPLAQIDTDEQTLAQVLAQGANANATIISNLLDPVAPQDAATRAFVIANSAGHTGTPGSIFFANGASIPSEINTQLFWDAANNRLGVGTNSGLTNKLTINGTTRTEGINNSDGSAGVPAYRFSSDGNSGMFLPSSGQLGLAANNTEAIRINASQNVGIGTTTPSAKLHVNGNLWVVDDFRDSTGDPGTTGQILSSTVGGTNWIDAPLGGASDGVITNIEISGTNLAVTGVNPGFTGNVNLEPLVDLAVGNNGYLLAEVDGDINNEIELPTGGSPGYILSTDGSGNYSWVQDNIGASKSSSSLNSIRKITASKVALTENDHTVILEGTVSQVNLPGATTANLGLILVIKDLGGATTTLNIPYIDYTGNKVFTTINGGVLWLQSDGTDWQLIK